MKEMKDRRCIIEASDPNHNWDSDYVSSESFTLAEAREYIKELQNRAETDPTDGDEAPDGISWLGWSFRIRAENDHGCYCVDVN